MLKHYKINVMPVSKSHGFVGSPFSHLVEYILSKEASVVRLLSAKFTIGK